MLSRWLTALLLLAGTASLASAQVDYVRDVKPIFAKHCYRCHGASQQKGGLRADTVAFLKEGGDTGASLTPGDSRASVLVQAILGTHDDISQMPYKKPALADADIATIRAWIDAGAAAPANEVPDKAVALGLRRAGAPRRARRRQARLVAQPHRPLHPRPSREGEDRARARGRSRDAPAPREPRSHRPAADARRVGRLPRRSRPRRLRARRRSPARLAALRRALGPPLARCRPLRRFQRLLHRRAAADVEIPRLGHRRLQPRPALRPVRHRAARRRSAARRHARPEDRHRLPPQHPDQPGRRHRPRAVPGRVRHRSREHLRHRLPRPHGRLRAVPRPQVRPDPPARVLPALRLLQQHGGRRPRQGHARRHARVSRGGADARGPPARARRGARRSRSLPQHPWARRRRVGRRARWARAAQARRDSARRHRPPARPADVRGEARALRRVPRGRRPSSAPATPRSRASSAASPSPSPRSSCPSCRSRARA